MAKKKKKKSTSVVSMQFLTSSISTTMVLVLLGLVVFFVLTANNLSTYVRENLTFSVLISDDLREADILKYKEQLDKKPFVKSSTYISKKQALQEETAAMNTDPKEFLGYNPYSASIEIHLNSNYANSDSIAVIEKQIKRNTNIKDVLYQQELIDAVNENLATFSLVLLGLAVLLTLISFALINNTIRLTIYSQRFLIHTMKLVGASWGFIRRPYLIRNVWGGVVAALMADFILTLLVRWLLREDPELIQVITPAVVLQMVLWVIALGVLITFCCAYISITRYLRMKANTLYYI